MYSTNFFQEFESKIGFFRFIPRECCLDVSINGWRRFHLVVGHFCFLLRRSRIAKAGRPLDGSAR